MHWNKKNNRPGLLLLLLAAPGWVFAQVNVRMLSLQDCIGMALTNSTAVLKGNNDVAIAGTQVLAAYGQYLPNVVAAGGDNYDLGNNYFRSDPGAPLQHTPL